MEKKNKAGSEKFSELRKRAEKNLEGRPADTRDLPELPTDDMRRLIHELRVHQVELEMQNEELRRSQHEFEALHIKYRGLYDFAPVGYFTLGKKGIILEINLAGAALLGAERNSLIKKPLTRFISRECQDVFYMHCKNVFETENRQVCEIRLKNKDGLLFFAILESIAIKDNEGNLNRIYMAVTDISDRKQAEELLKQAHDELEQRVKKRTAELNAANRKLEMKTMYLEEANIAMKILLQKRNEDKTELEKNVLSNAKELFMPYLEKLKKSRLNDKQKNCLDILESNLNDFVSPFVREVSSGYLGLTPTEIQVANLVKQGKSTKEIADALALSTRTIDSYRNNIRKKLRIKNKKVNLRTYLLSIK